jgi:hypothetical protein
MNTMEHCKECGNAKCNCEYKAEIEALKQATNHLKGAEPKSKN